MVSRNKGCGHGRAEHHSQLCHKTPQSPGIGSSSAGGRVLAPTRRAKDACWRGPLRQSEPRTSRPDARSGQLPLPQQRWKAGDRAVAASPAAVAPEWPRLAAASGNLQKCRIRAPAQSHWVRNPGGGPAIPGGRRPSHLCIAALGGLQGTPAQGTVQDESTD